MKYSMLMVGAHDGSKSEKLINTASKVGQILLIEPVSRHYEKLINRYGNNDSINVLNEAVSLNDGIVDFYELPEKASLIDGAADQLGSLISTHAIEHKNKLKEMILITKCKTRTFKTLINDYNISELDVLITDIEGIDVDLLIQFPFAILRPYQIVFEAKHADGVMHLGKKMATLLLILDALDYKVSIHSSENFLAVDKKADPSKYNLRITF